MINLSDYKTHNELKELRSTEKEAIKQKKMKSNVLSVYKFLVGKSLGKTNLGACTYKVSTIASEVNISLATATRCIKSLKDMQLIEVINKTKGNGIKGANVYRILPTNKIEVSNEVSDTLNLSYREELELLTESKDEVVKEEAESLSFNLLNKSFKTSNLINIYNNAHAGNEFLNDWQKELSQLLTVLKFDELFGDEFHKVIAATEINDVKDFHIAKEIIVSIAKDLQCGKLSVSKTLRAIYKGAEVKRKENVMAVENAGPAEQRYVPTYNFLEQREFDFKF